MRDYDQEERGTELVKPYGIREEDGRRYVIFQVMVWTQRLKQAVRPHMVKRRSARKMGGTRLELVTSAV